MESYRYIIYSRQTLLYFRTSMEALSIGQDWRYALVSLPDAHARNGRMRIDVDCELHASDDDENHDSLLVRSVLLVL